MSAKKTEMNPSIESQLSELDLSDESVIRESLGAELAWENRKNGVSNKGNFQVYRNRNIFRKPLPAFALGLVAAFAMMGAANPDALSSIVEIFQVGEHTQIVQSGPRGEAEITAILGDFDNDLESGKSYFTYSVYGGWGGAVPHGADPFIKQFSSLSLAAREVDYPLHVPTFGTEKNPLITEFCKAEILPDGMAILYFGLGRYETILVQKPVGNGMTRTSSTVTTKVLADGTKIQVGLKPNLEELEIAGKKVIWQIHDQHIRPNLGVWAKKYPDEVIGKFIWESGGMSFTLNGLLLTKEEGIKIIQSIQPIGK